MFAGLTALSFLLVLGFVAHTQQQENDPTFMKDYNADNAACAQEQSLTMDYINQIWGQPQFPNDPKVKSYLLCFNKKLGVIDASGKVLDDVLGKVAAEFFNSTIDATVTKDCDVQSQTDPCETAFALMQCVKAKSA